MGVSSNNNKKILIRFDLIVMHVNYIVFDVVLIDEYIGFVMFVFILFYFVVPFITFGAEFSKLL